jgi:hypothetical protein
VVAFDGGVDLRACAKVVASDDEPPHEFV